MEFKVLYLRQFGEILAHMNINQDNLYPHAHRAGGNVNQPGVLGFGGVCPINNHNLNMVNFLRSQGLHALSERFLAEEIEVEQIARLPTRT